MLTDVDFAKIIGRSALDVGRVTDVVDMDAFSNGAGMTYWNVRQEVFKIYSEGELCVDKQLTCSGSMVDMTQQLNKATGCPFPHFKIFYECPDILKGVKHIENYKKAN